MHSLRPDHDTGPVDRYAELPPGSLRVRLAAVERAALARASRSRGRGATSVTVASRPGLSLTGPTVAASDGRRLVVVCAHHDGVVRVLAGSWPELREASEIDAISNDLAVPVALVSFDDDWHLFARGRNGGSVHLVANADLATWRVCPTLGADFPAFAVSGACVVDGRLLLAGRVFVERLVFGWGLLSGGPEGFVARQVPSSLASPLGVLGPLDDGRGTQRLVLQVGTNCRAAASHGRGWTSAPMPVGLSPTTMFDLHGDPWVAGYDPVSSRVRLGHLGVDRFVDLDEHGDEGPSMVSCAVAHGDHVVLVRED